MKKFERILTYVFTAFIAAGLTFAVMCRLNSPGKLDELETLITEKFIGEADTTALEDAAADAMVTATGDRWSYYISAADYESHMEQMNNAYVGIGVTILEEDSGMRVKAVTAGGPAETVGIQVEDLIIAVDATPLAGLSASETRNLVRGEEGTQVSLTIERGGVQLDLTVTRTTVQTQVASGQMLDGNIGLVTIENFDSRCASEVQQAIQDLVDTGAKALIFDVRNNPGGYANELVDVLDTLLPEGEVFRTVDYRGNEQVDYSDADCIELPMAVMVNENSYSAAEFFAAALQEYGKAIVVGNQTVGKGYFQNTFRLSDGSAVGLSVGKYYTPQGRNLAGVGVTPDIEVEVDDETAANIYYDAVEPEDDPQIQAAAEYLWKQAG